MPMVGFDLCPGIYTKQMCVCVGVWVCARPRTQGSPNWADKHADSCSLQLYQAKKTQGLIPGGQCSLWRTQCPPQTQKVASKSFERKNKCEVSQEPR